VSNAERATARWHRKNPVSPDVALGFIRAAADLIWASADCGAPDACWPWKRGCSGSGYGQLHIPGFKTVAAHRAALALSTGEFGAVAKHSCDFKLCINPAHLAWSDHLSNMREAAERGLMRPGQLSAGDVHTISQASANGERQRDIAERFGVSQASISRVLNLHRRVP
jgi:hypothetical protein